MRLLDENKLLVIDSSHFRYIRLDGERISFFNDMEDKQCPAVLFNSPEEAKEKFEDLKGEAGWFSFKSKNLPALINSFGFKEFYVKKAKMEMCGCFSIIAKMTVSLLTTAILMTKPQKL